MRKFRPVLAAAVSVACALGGCAVNEPARLRASEGQLPNGASVSLLPGSESAPLHGQLHAALANAFAAQEVPLADAGTLIADFGISVQDADVGQVLDPDMNGDSNAIDWQARPRTGQIFDSCDPVRAQATLALFNRQSGTIAYRGEAEAIACTADEIDIASLADVLVRQTLAADMPDQP